MTGEVYRFLLRMPAELRDQLKAAAARSGRSLNAELVDRLERSLADEQGVLERLKVHLRQTSPGGKDMPDSHRRRRLALGAAVAFGVLVVALIAGALTRDSGTQATGAAQPSVGEAFESGAMSPLLRQKLAASQTFSPGGPETEQGEAGEGAGDGAQEWYAHAAPGNDIPLAAISGSREDWAGLKSRGNSAARAACAVSVA